MNAANPAPFELSPDTPFLHQDLPIRMTYVEMRKVAHFLQTTGQKIACLIYYSRPDRQVPLLGDSVSQIVINLDQLNHEPMVEIWWGNSPFRRVEEDGFRLAYNQEALHGYFAGDEQGGQILEHTARVAYEGLLKHTRALGFPYLWRIWNYFPHINHEQGGLERYKSFCIGRQQAFARLGKHFTRLLPAASAIGTQSGSFQLLFVAGKQAGRHIENPRQISAYHYPAIYGPRSPAFSRGTLISSTQEATLFIAGTSSIVGHTTRHAGNPGKQTRETLQNVETLIQHASKCSSVQSQMTQPSTTIKVYIRHLEDVPMIQDIIRDECGASASILFLQGDICRHDLLVEIEASLSSQFAIR